MGSEQRARMASAIGLILNHRTRPQARCLGQGRAAMASQSVNLRHRVGGFGGFDIARPGKPAIVEAAEEQVPERLVLRIARINTEHVAVPVSTKTRWRSQRFWTLHGGVRGHGHRWRRATHINNRLMTQPARPPDVGVDLFADPSRHRIADTSVAAMCSDGASRLRVGVG